ncbi:efflux RND transporter periplasmic adaptor subunit [Paludisphaera mucosa]|uniref:Efflux RND transporter periplasmic adaptor subunit n=1 Tax=Paludisphaera mucosa TaxID=3030827 RepID=A0ABT6F7I5_9BACT|nr:efflux RND transporter periplasmic adaptor subunit [Paludisphaera mucosa]MDG3003355.1 efflux RND transporter periplasmic adaptor subunit [Paludisphaera mucosa]
MSLALSQRLATGRRPRPYLVPWCVAVVLLIVLVLHLTIDLPGHLTRIGAAPNAVAAGAAASPPEASPSPGTVSLSDVKLKAAGVTTDKVRADHLPTELGVAGKIEVNADRRVEVRSRAPGIVREVHALLGQKVKKGQLLATLDSPDIGTARLNLRARQRELLTARIEAGWKDQIAGTVAQLIPEISKGVDPEVLEREYADKPLGSFRGLLLQTYSEFDIASHEEEKTLKLRSEQVIGEHPAVVAKHTRQGLQAKLFSTIEQAKFDAAQQRRLAEQARQLAESAVVDAGQRLRILGVDEDIQALLDHAEDAQKAAKDEDVTAYRINAPFDGTIITKSAVPSQRADTIDLLFTVADLGDVWVTANIPESDLAKIPTIEGGPVRLTATAYPDRVFEARLLSVGAILDPTTRTVPLLARTENLEGLLRPGMFARILFDGPVNEAALTIPAGALVEIEGRPAVFRPTGSASEAPSFALHHIEIGRQLGDRIVVKSGLKEGDAVVAKGAFVLKSELILQNEGDED